MPGISSKASRTILRWECGHVRHSRQCGKPEGVWLVPILSGATSGHSAARAALAV